MFEAFGLTSRGPKRLARFALLLTLAIWAANGALFLAKFTAFLGQSQGVIQRDFTAFYFLADGIRRGIDPNLPLPVLGAALGLPGLTLFPHPTPHPPTAGMLLMPLTALSLPAASVLWLLLSGVAVLADAILLLRLAKVSFQWWLTVPISLALITWQPIHDDLSWGNVNTIILLFLTGMTVCIISRHRSAAGVLLALSLLLKPIAWPVLLGLAIRRQWRTVASCCATCLSIGIMTILVVGPSRVLEYLASSLPAATQYYQRDFLNFSATSVAMRLFEGVQHPLIANDGTPRLYFAPITNAQNIADVMRVLIVFGLVLGALFAIRNRSVECTIGVMVCISVAASPTSWSHYFTLGLLPIALIVRGLAAHNWPARQAKFSALLVCLFVIPVDTWLNSALLIGPTSLPPNKYWPVGPSVLALAPTYLLLGLAILSIALDAHWEARTCFDRDAVRQHEVRHPLLVRARAPTPTWPSPLANELPMNRLASLPWRLGLVTGGRARAPSRALSLARLVNTWEVFVRKEPLPPA